MNGQAISPVEHLEGLAEKGQLKWKAFLRGRRLPCSVDPNKDIEFSLIYPVTGRDISNVTLRTGPTIIYEKIGDNPEWEMIGRTYKTNYHWEGGRHIFDGHVKTPGGDYVPDGYHEVRYGKLIAPGRIDANGFNILPAWGDRTVVATYLREVLPYLTDSFREQQPFKLEALALPEGSLPEDNFSASFRFPNNIIFDLHPDLRKRAVADLARQSVALHINDTARIITPTLDEIVRNLDR